MLEIRELKKDCGSKGLFVSVRTACQKYFAMAMLTKMSFPRWEQHTCMKLQVSTVGGKGSSGKGKTVVGMSSDKFPSPMVFVSQGD